MKIVYIAGPYGDAGGYLQIDRNIAQAREAAADLAAAGIGYVCPHLNSAHMEAIVPDVPVTFWHELDDELLRRADAILILPRWHDSSGTRREMRIAEKLGKPAFYYGDRSEELYAGEWANLLEWARS